MKLKLLTLLCLAVGSLIISFGFTPPIPKEMYFICDKIWLPINQGHTSYDNKIIYGSDYSYSFNPEESENYGFWSFEKDKKIHIRFKNTTQEWIITIVKSTEDSLVLKTQNDEVIEYVASKQKVSEMQLSKFPK